MYDIALLDETATNVKVVIPRKGGSTATNSQTITLPAAGLPDEIEMTAKADNEKYSVLTVGEIVVPGLPALRTYSLNFVLPHDNDIQPSYYLNWLRNIIEKRRVLRLVIVRKDMQAGDIYNTNIQVVIDQYKVTEKAGSIGDMWVEMKLQEYRPVAVGVIS